MKSDIKKLRAKRRALVDRFISLFRHQKAANAGDTPRNPTHELESALRELRLIKEREGLKAKYEREINK